MSRIVDLASWPIRANSLHSDISRAPAYKRSISIRVALVFIIPLRGLCIPFSIFSHYPVSCSIFLSTAYSFLRVFLLIGFDSFSYLQPAHYRLVRASFNLVAEQVTACSASWHLWNRRSRTLRSLYILYWYSLLRTVGFLEFIIYQNSYQFNSLHSGTTLSFLWISVFLLV